MKNYCITMELVQRAEFRFPAPDDAAAVDEMDRRFARFQEDPSLFRGGDTEISFALDEANGRTVVPWTDPEGVDVPDGPGGDVGNEDPSGDCYAGTVERVRRAAEWFMADDDAAAEEKARTVLGRYAASPSLFDGMDEEHDYALDAPDGGTVVPWD